MTQREYHYPGGQDHDQDNHGNRDGDKEFVEDKNVTEFKAALKNEIGNDTDQYLLHGTTAKNAKSIEEVGIVPDVGDFVRDAYGSDYEAAGLNIDDIATPLSFFAPASDSEERAAGGGAMTAMQHHVAASLDKGFHDVTEKDILEHGALVVVNRNDGDFTEIKGDSDGQYAVYPDGWVGVEPGDVVSESAVPAEKIIRGEALLKLWRPWQRTFAFAEAGRHMKRYAHLFHLPDDHEQESHGNWADGDREESREERAKRSYVKIDAKKRAKATAHERSVSQYVDGVDLPDNEPFDVIVGKKHAIEVKAIIDGKNPKITMHPESLKRKTSFLRRRGMTGHTVVIDARGDRPQYYYKAGVGSFRLSGMEKISASQIRSYIQ